MRAAGIIAEYNPFHNGHERHIRETRRRTGCDCVIVAMNGSISQRGEMMLLDKWTRAEMALRGGADIVVELPALWGVRPAENFALGGVAILHALGCEWLSFGCETDDLRLLEETANLLEEEPQEYRALLQEALREGKSFARARGEALSRLTQIDEELLAGPNFALALEYLRAIRRLQSQMRPVSVLRGASHHAQEIAPETSASAIRRAVFAGDIARTQPAMPEYAYGLLRENTGAITNLKALDVAVLMALRALDRAGLAALPDVTEGLENRLWSACRSAGTREELLALCKSRRYTYARLSRIAAHALLKTNQSLLCKYLMPAYARLLGVRRSALGMLSELQKNSALPVVDRARQLKGDTCFETDCRATDLRALLSIDPARRAADADFTQRLPVVD